MSSLLNAKAICERALRLIGAYSLVDSQADAEEMAEALHWLDLILAELSGTHRIYWLVPATVAVPLVAGQGTYDVLNACTPTLPNGMEFPIEAWREDSSGNRTPVQMVSHRDFNAIEPTAGLPTAIHIDRLTGPTMRLNRVPGAELEPNTQFIKLVVQTYAGTFSGTNGVKETGLRAAWQKWAIYELSSNIGAGPVRRVSATEIADFRKVAAASLTALLGYENQQHLSQPQLTEFRDF